MLANALDSGATRIDLRADPANAYLTVVDTGRGMTRRELARYCAGKVGGRQLQ